MAQTCKFEYTFGECLKHPFVFGHQYKLNYNSFASNKVQEWTWGKKSAKIMGTMGFDD
jgi:hypothetical protein